MRDWSSDVCSSDLSSDQIFSGRDFAFVVGHFVGGDSHRASGDDLGGHGRLYDVVLDDSVVAVFMPARRAAARGDDLVVLSSSQSSFR